MNTIAWLASIPATLWLAVYTYNTLSIQPLFVLMADTDHSARDWGLAVLFIWSVTWVISLSIILYFFSYSMPVSIFASCAPVFLMAVFGAQTFAKPVYKYIRKVRKNVS
jgi:hypothetical protein